MGGFTGCSAPELDSPQPRTVDKNLLRLHAIDEVKWTTVLSITTDNRWPKVYFEGEPVRDAERRRRSGDKNRKAARDVAPERLKSSEGRMRSATKRW